MNEQESAFTTEGFRPFPSLYQDNLQVREFSSWSTDALNNHFQDYTEFMKGEVMPRAAEESRRVLSHLLFELMYRSTQDNE